MSGTSRNSLYIHVEGIYCAHCVETISRTLGSLDGVEAVSLRRNVARISGTRLPSAGEITQAIRAIGYETDESRISGDRTKVSRTVRWYEFLLIAAVILLIAFGVRRLFGYNVFNAIPAVDSSLSLGMLFVTGLLTSIHCISMCGAIGIFASSESNSVRSFRRPLLYNAGRVISYALTGGIVGLAGSVFSISMTLRGTMILIAAVFMILMAFSMLGILPFQLPVFRALHAKSGKAGAFIIGLLNGLMPCGPLQSMQIYALSSGSFLGGALSMTLFALGTVPLMLVSGAVINLSRGKARNLIGKAAAVLMLILSLSMLNRGLVSLGLDIAGGSPSRYDGYLPASAENGIQTVEFDLEYDSYADIVVQKNLPVRIVIRADERKITGCNNEVVSRDFDFDVPIAPGDNVIEFTPAQEGIYTYTCWMNMIKNHILVVEDLGSQPQ